MSSEKNYTEVCIDGRIYTLGGQEEEAYLQKVASYLNDKIGTMRAKSGFSRMNPDYQMLMLQLNVADDYFKAYQQLEKLRIRDRGLGERKLQPET